MSTSEEKLNNEREILDIQKKRTKEKERQREIEADSLSLSNSLVDSIKEIQGISTKRSTFDQNLLKINKQISNEILGQKKDLQSVVSIDKQILKNKDLITKGKTLSASLDQAIVGNDARKLRFAERKIAKINEERYIQNKLLAAAELGGKFNKKAYEQSVENQIIQENSLNRQIKYLSNSAKQALFTKQNTLELEKHNKEREKEAKTLKENEKKLGAFGGLLKGIGKIPILGDLVDTDEILGSAMNKIKEGGSGVAGLGAGLKTAGKQMLKSITNPANLALFAFTSMVTALIKADSQIVGLQKSMALSKTEAIQFKSSLSLAAAKSGEISVTGTKLLKTFTDLNAQFGFITNFSTDTLVTMTKLTQVVKLSSEAAGSLAGASLVTGDNFEDNYKNALGTSYELQRQSGVQFDLKGILEETGKVTGTVRANLGGSVERMAEAVTEAKLLGASLDQVAKAGGALLDFQSSIKSEMEAELLTGKQLNLEAARHAALTGDQATLAKELKENMGDFSEFSEMNVIQQKALADAMGMSSDEMADILFQQEVQNRSAKELRALGEDELANRLEQKTAGDKFNDTIAKLKDVLVDVMGGLTPILDIFSLIAKMVGLIVSPLVAISNWANSFGPVMGGIVSLLLAAGAAALFLAGNLTLGIGVPIILAAVGAGMAYMDSNIKSTGDLISPANGKTQISTKEGGLFELSKNDDVMAGPNIASNSNTSTSNISMDITPIVDEISQLRREMNSLLTTIANKDSSVYMDGNRVGKSLALGSSNMGA